jgi:glycosyltransferase involved in cell wall biosynthesis
MVRVLVTSAAHILSDYLLTSEGNYCYNFFKHMDKYEYQFEALSPYIRVRRPLSNVIFHQVGSFKMSPTSSAFTRIKLHAEFLLRGLVRATRILREKQIDLVHHMLPAVFNNTFSPLALLVEDLKRPFIMGPVSAHYYRRPASEEIFLPLTSKLHRATVGRCDRLIAITSRMRELYTKIIGEERIRVIPFAVDTDLFKPSLTDSGNDGFEVLYAGSLYTLKGVDYLIRAMADVDGHGLKARLTIVGEGQQKKDLMALARKLHISKNVMFEGFVPYADMPKYYKQCDVFCFPTLGEPFGEAVIEAMACGKPVIATNIGGPSEIIQDQVDGILVPPFSPGAIAQQIIRLIEDQKETRRLGERARETAVNRFSWDTVAEKYHQLYSELL